MTDKLDAIPGSTGRKIIDGLKDAVAGNFASVTIEGQRWVRDHAPGPRKPHPGKDSDAMLDEIKRISDMPEDAVIAMARKAHVDLRLTLARQITNEYYFYGDFHPDAPDRATQESLCEHMAKAEGWRDAGLFFKHSTDGEYRKSDMDGWRDLCSNEGILP